jgi:hypothetical protein
MSSNKIAKLYDAVLNPFLEKQIMLSNFTISDMRDYYCIIQINDNKLRCMFPKDFNKDKFDINKKYIFNGKLIISETGTLLLLIANYLEDDVDDKNYDKEYQENCTRLSHTKNKNNIDKILTSYRSNHLSGYITRFAFIFVGDVDMDVAKKILEPIKGTIRISQINSNKLLGSVLPNKLSQYQLNFNQEFQKITKGYENHHNIEYICLVCSNISQCQSYLLSQISLCNLLLERFTKCKKQYFTFVNNPNLDKFPIIKDMTHTCYDSLENAVNEIVGLQTKERNKLMNIRQTLVDKTKKQVDYYLSFINTVSGNNNKLVQISTSTDTEYYYKHLYVLERLRAAVHREKTNIVVRMSKLTMNINDKLRLNLNNNTNTNTNDDDYGGIEIN